MTPREWAAECRAARLRRNDEYQRDVALAYTGVAFYSRAVAGNLPPLRTLLAETNMSTRTATREQHAMQLTQLSEHLGVAFRPLSPEAKAALARLRARGE